MSSRAVTDAGGELSLRTGLEDISAHEHHLLTSLLRRSIATPLRTQ